MGLENALNFLKSVKGLPPKVPDANDARMSGSGYGEQWVLPIYGKKHILAEQGAYFVVTNPTPFTGIATTTSIVTFAETAGAVGVVFLLKNNDRSVMSPKRIFFDYIKLMVTAVPTSATNWQYAFTIDDSPVRWTSGGSAITPVNPNGESQVGSIATCYFGALTTAVPANRRLVARGTLRGVIPTVFDEFVIISGGADGGSGFASAAASGKSVDHCPPIILAPGQNLALTLWGTSCGAAPSYEFEGGFWEK